VSVVGIDGKPRDDEMPAVTPLSVLRSLVQKIENGEFAPEQVVVICAVSVPERPGHVTHPTWDSGLTVAETVYLLETAKFDIFEAIRR